MESQVLEAHRNWFPSGELTSLVAPDPRVECRPPNQRPYTSHVSTASADCISTNADPIARTPAGDLTNFSSGCSRTELRLVQPIWDFGKISAGVSAAEAGVRALSARAGGPARRRGAERSQGLLGTEAGARAARSALEEGNGYVDGGAEEDRQGAGSGQRQRDRHRAGCACARCAAEIDARTLETKRLADLALAGLRTLVDREAPADLDIDEAPFEPSRSRTARVTYYEEQARLSIGPRCGPSTMGSKPSTRCPTSSDGARGTRIWC